MSHVSLLFFFCLHQAELTEWHRERWTVNQSLLSDTGYITNYIEGIPKLYSRKILSSIRRLERFTTKYIYKCSSFAISVIKWTILYESNRPPVSIPNKVFREINQCTAYTDRGTRSASVNSGAQYSVNGEVAQSEASRKGRRCRNRAVTNTIAVSYPFDGGIQFIGFHVCDPGTG